MDFAAFDALTFDCYGTLVDWERGILDSLRPILSAHDSSAGEDDAVLERFGRWESRIEADGYRSYRQVLREVLDGFGADLGFRPTEGEREAFAASVAAWPVFGDTVASLRALGSRYRLAIVSNVDDDLFAGSARRLEVEFDQVVTAAQVQAYKPAPDHFDEVLRRLDLPRERVLHVAQSLYHDVAPARKLGFTTVWVNRRAGRPGGGATAASEAVPHLEVPDLETLVKRIGAA